ncbi:MAG: TraX family protein [Erysipelotrichaceae bacterium]|nr:TraX family protein [Erysipelotrichaceae bacterium]
MSSFALHIIAMIFMLCDHMWATILDYEWLTCLGRIAFPIFAFLITEGYIHTSNINKYIKRMVIFAIITEIPFNLMVSASPIYPFHQNVLWTFVISLLTLKYLNFDNVKNSFKSILIILLAIIIATVTMCDYFGAGVMMVVGFYIFRKSKFLQLLMMIYVNMILIQGYSYPIDIAGYTYYFPQQGFAVLSLIFIWLYNGKQGYHAKWFKIFCYAFYPLHMLILYILTIVLFA